MGSCDRDTDGDGDCPVCSPGSCRQPTGYIHPWAFVGEPPEQRGFEGDGIPPDIHPTARLEYGVTVDAGTTVATHIGARTWLMKKVHVGHDAQIGADCELAPLCSVGGHVVIAPGVKVGQGATFKPYVTIGELARIGMGAVVIHDVPAGETWAGNPARRIDKGYEAARAHYEDLWPDAGTLAAGDEELRWPAKHDWQTCSVFPGCCSQCRPETIMDQMDLNADGVWKRRERT